MQFNLKAVPRVDVDNEANEFFLSISKEELLSQHEKDAEQFCITLSYALTMLCSPHSFSPDMDDDALLDLLRFAKSDEEIAGLAFVVEYQQGRTHLVTGLEYQ